jgi:hypothetical protein
MATQTHTTPGVAIAHPDADGRRGPSTGHSGCCSADGSAASWPELGEELARKALDTLADALARHEMELITDRELDIVVNTITDTTMGLIPKDVTNTIYAVRKELEK